MLVVEFLKLVIKFLLIFQTTRRMMMRKRKKLQPKARGKLVKTKAQLPRNQKENVRVFCFVLNISITF